MKDEIKEYLKEHLRLTVEHTESLLGYPAIKVSLFFDDELVGEDMDYI